MERKLHQEPVFDLEAMRHTLDEWKANKASHVFVEWSTGTGPTVFVYPAGERKFGFKWTVAVETNNYNEVYADFIEQTLVPRLRELNRQMNLETSVRCVDLQPLQVQRQRRRQIERSHTGAAAH